jgi:hypothetical protein
MLAEHKNTNRNIGNWLQKKKDCISLVLSAPLTKTKNTQNKTRPIIIPFSIMAKQFLNKSPLKNKKKKPAAATAADENH